jgi:hypothetical protein
MGKSSMLRRAKLRDWVVLNRGRVRVGLARAAPFFLSSLPTDTDNFQRATDTGNFKNSCKSAGSGASKEKEVPSSSNERREA